MTFKVKYDKIYDKHILYLNGNTYTSTDNFILSSDKYFQVPVDGYIEIDVLDNNNNYVNSYVNICINGNSEGTDSYSGIVTKGDSIWLKGDPANFSNIVARPYFKFYPDSGSYIQIDTNANPHDTIFMKDTLRGYLPIKMEFQHEYPIYNNKVYRRLFGPLYNGWGQFAYHSKENDSIINLSSLIVPEVLSSGVATIEDTSDIDSMLSTEQNVTNYTSSASYEEFQEKNPNFYNPLSYNSCWVEMTPDFEHWAWVSYGLQNSIMRDTMSNSLRREWYSSNPELSDDDAEVPEIIIYDDPVPSAVENTPAKAVRKVNRSYNSSNSFGALGFGYSESSGNNTIVTDYMDLNGDRYPDIIGNVFVQYSQQWGGIGGLTELPYNIGDNNISITSSNGVSYSTTPIEQKRMPSNNVGRAKFTLQSGSSGSITGGGNVGRDTTSGTWMDINGDGLVDFVYKNGGVSLNTGYGFMDAENWNFNTVRSGISGSVSVAAGMSGSEMALQLLRKKFVVCQRSIEGGIDISASYNQTKKMLIDINGDGIYMLKELGISSHLYRMLPYLVTLVVLAFTSGKSRAPKAEGIPYDKGSR